MLPINLSILDFKDGPHNLKAKYKTTINLSILDFKDEMKGEWKWK